MKIYRIQDSDGRGPFKPGFSIKWSEDKSKAWYLKMRGWVEEFGVDILRRQLIGSYVGSGCLTKGQLREWFTAKEYATLLSLGHEAVEVEVDRLLAQNQTQCVWEKAGSPAEGAQPFKLYHLVKEVCVP
jgi:hypothetical protein